MDYVALSFVRSPEDIRTVQTALAERSANIPVIAKIERPEALTCFDEILDIADGVMIARGDLALELSPEEVPLLAKTNHHPSQSKRKACHYGHPNAGINDETTLSPTRAEASDVANAVLDGTDAVMLSAETSTGNYPIEAVQVMDRIIRHYRKGWFHLKCQSPIPQSQLFYRLRKLSVRLPSLFQVLVVARSHCRVY